MRRFLVAALLLFPLAILAATDPFQTDRMVINSGSYPGDNTGDSRWVWSRKDNTNFTTLFARTDQLHAGMGAGGLSNASAVATLALSDMATNSAAWRAQMLINAPIRPQWYGAKGDGVTDDTAAIQAALDAAAANVHTNLYAPGNIAIQRGGAVFLPNGIYKITSQLELHPGQEIRGESREGTVIQNYGTTNFVLHANPTTGANLHYTIEDLSIFQLYGSAPTTGGGIYLHGVYGASSIACTIRNVETYGCYVGVRLSCVQGGVVDKVNAFYSISNGFQCDTPMNATAFSGCYAGNNGGDGYRGSFGYCTFTGCASDSNTGFGYNLTASANSTAFMACGAEENTAGGVYLANCVATRWHGYVVAKSAATNNAITVDGGYNNEIGGPVLTSGGQAIGWGLLITNAAGRTVTLNNFSTGDFSLGALSDPPKCVYVGSNIAGGGFGFGHQAEYPLDLWLAGTNSTVARWVRNGYGSMSWKMGADTTLGVGADPATEDMIFSINPNAYTNSLVIGAGQTTFGQNLVAADNAIYFKPGRLAGLGFNHRLGGTAIDDRFGLYQTSASTNATTQVGYLQEQFGTTSASDSMVEISTSQTLNAGITTARSTGLQINAPTLGAGAAYDYRYGVWIRSQTNATVASANLLLGDTFSLGVGTWNIYSDLPTPNYIAGPFQFGSYARLPNNTWLYGRNAGDSNNIAAIGIDAADQVAIAPGGQATTIGGALKMGSVPGLTTNINVLIAGGTTNQLQFTSGVLTGVVPQ